MPTCLLAEGAFQCTGSAMIEFLRNLVDEIVRVNCLGWVNQASSAEGRRCEISQVLRNSMDDGDMVVIIIDTNPAHCEFFFACAQVTEELPDITASPTG